MKHFYTKSALGFTLMEMMIVLVVLAVLVTIALPTYEGMRQRARRGDAITSLMRAQLKQEKHRADNIAYTATLADIDFTTSSIEGFYTMSIVSNSATGFVISAAPAGAQAGDSCGTYAVSEEGPFYAGYASRDCWGR